MSDPSADHPFPPGALFGAGALIGLTLLSVTVARLSGVGTMEMPVAAPVETRALRFEDRPDGAVAVYDARKRRVVKVLAPGTNNFVRGVLRGFARARMLAKVGPQPPFVLTRWADGRLSLADPATGRSVDLGAFGPTNVRAFARLLATWEGV